MQLQKGIYYLALPEGGKVITMQFTTWVFRQYANEKGQTLDDMIGSFANGFVSTDTILDLMLIGAKYSFLKSNVGAAFPYTDLDAADWLDAMGGITGEKTKDIAAVIVGSLANQEPAEVKKLMQAATDEKKSA